PEGIESYKTWKATLDDWQDFLNKLQQLKNPPFPPIAHQKNSSPKNQLQSENAFANQQSPPDTEARTSENEVRKGENDVIIDEKILTSSENDSPQTPPNPPPPNADSKKQSPPKSAADSDDVDDEHEDDADDEN